jgi:hypothetical protein
VDIADPARPGAPGDNKETQRSSSSTNINILPFTLRYVKYPHMPQIFRIKKEHLEKVFLRKIQKELNCSLQLAAFTSCSFFSHEF